MVQRRKGSGSMKGKMRVFSTDARRKRSASEQLADLLTDSFGTIAFFVLNATFFFGWILWNIDIGLNLPVFDPYPFGMLTMVVSLEAIFLSVIVLISQNRAAKIADLREEVDLQINIESEKEITQMLKMLEGIEKKLSVKELNGADLKRMKKVLDLVDLEKKVVKELER
jgi:uncharacterized membrane protein